MVCVAHNECAYRIRRRETDTPDIAPKFMDLLGSRFIAHPDNQKIHVRVTDVSHPVY